MNPRESDYQTKQYWLNIETGNNPKGGTGFLMKNKKRRQGK